MDNLVMDTSINIILPIIYGGILLIAIVWIQSHIEKRTIEEWMDEEVSNV